MVRRKLADLKEVVHTTEQLLIANGTTPEKHEVINKLNEHLTLTLNQYITRFYEINKELQYAN